MNTVINPPAKKCDPQTLRQQVKQTAAKPRERAESMPSGIYTDKEFMDFETREIFRKEWISLCHVSQVAKPGGLMTMQPRTGEVSTRSASAMTSRYQRL